MEIGDRIKRERAAAGLTQEQLADRIGVNKSAVAQWESANSRKGITTSNLMKVANLLAIPVTRLIGGDETDILQTTDADEIALIKLFRQMSADQKDIHLRLFYTSVGLTKPLEPQRDPLQGKRVSR
jgi:transcriptional regulator with XRE-family HTH domain